MVVMISTKEADLAQGEAEDLAIHFLLLLLRLLTMYDGSASDAHDHDADAAAAGVVPVGLLATGVRKYGSDKF